MTQARRIFGAAAVMLLLAACSRAADPNAPPPLSEVEKAGYLPAPDIVTVTAAADGAPLVRGRTRPSSRIRATLPSGEAYGATADAQGRFEMELPGDGGPVMVAISAEDAGRSTPAEGWLFAPGGGYGYAALLRAGSSSRPLSAHPPMIAVIDFDAAGGAGVSGRVAARADVRVTLDGASAGEARADGQGRYSVRFNPPAGLHRLRVTAGGRSQERDIDFSAATAPPAGPFAATRVGEGWRVDWVPPGGGAQTTFIFSGGGAS